MRPRITVGEDQCQTWKERQDGAEEEAFDLLEYTGEKDSTEKEELEKELARGVRGYAAIGIVASAAIGAHGAGQSEHIRGIVEQ